MAPKYILDVEWSAAKALGYGDYTPAGELGRTFAIVEALFGQLYLVTVIAVLVSRMRRKES